MKNEDITLDVRVRYSSGAHVCRCNGKTVSTTGNVQWGVERVAEKVIAAIAATLQAPEVATRRKTVKQLPGDVWQVTYHAPQTSLPL